MAAIQWEQKYEVGVKKIDKQHKKIVDVLNKLYDMQDGRVDPAKLQRIFDDLRGYIEEHFSTEEAYLEEYACDGIENQRKRHSSFIDTVCGFQKDLLKKSPVALINLFNYIWDWFAHHILVEDKRCLVPAAE